MQCNLWPQMLLLRIAVVSKLQYLIHPAEDCDGINMLTKPATQQNLCLYQHDNVNKLNHTKRVMSCIVTAIVSRSCGNHSKVIQQCQVCVAQAS